MKTFLNTFNRALIKRVELLPNVSEFYTFSYGIHEYAAVFGVEKILREKHSVKLHAGHPNKYLEWQAVRLMRYAANGQVAEYNSLSEIMTRKSICFRLVALNRTMEDWFQMPVKKLSRIWRRLSTICRNNSSDLRYKRVWIDKKPGDYARPLGVPTPEWRCYSFMKMDIIERFFKAGGYLQPWQHGGRSGVGVLSCYEMLIPKLLSAKYVFEFDIKGFFDNISHEKIIQRFRQTLGIKFSEWIAQILEAKPLTYTLPDKECDIAVKKWNDSEEYLLDYYPQPASAVFTTSYINPKESEGKFLEIEFPSKASEPIFEVIQKDGTPITIPKINWMSAPEGANPKEWKPITMDEVYDFLDPEDKAILDEFSNEKHLTGPIYKDLMNGSSASYQSHSELHLSPSESERALGRDYWKSLGQPGKGVPQGLGTSPFISTFMTDTYLYQLGTEYKNLIMYMDDGILFADSKEEMNYMKLRLTECLGALGLEIEPSKSNSVKEEGKWINSIKFLGLRYLPEENTFMSDTRSGTQMKFPASTNWDDIRTMARMNGMNVSMTRQTFDKLINMQSFEAGLKYGFLGCIIAGSQYKDMPSLNERRNIIRQAQAEAWAQLENSKGFIWKFQDLYHAHTNQVNASSISVHRFLKLLKAGIPLYQVRNGRRIRKG